MGKQKPSPDVYYWDTEGYPPGEYAIQAFFVSSDHDTVRREIVITLLEVCVECPPKVKDFEGNIYPVVQIGNQCWMQENLRSTHFANGTPLKNGNDSLDNSFPTAYTTLPAPLTEWFFSYDGDSSYSEHYGYLYTWATAMNGGH